MVRVFIKGGVWKNSEDEVLKAAVMKYGKQQWARVASLLNRKSAKQCKARWNEWLDPSVCKIEWSHEEDEKLLHLAKILPAQWRTIGPLVGGRTAVQCQERYERLLDEAAVDATKNANEDKSSTLEAISSASSARKLRPGDIDPHPETKPARPDPIDMDEDEIEMLQEARARLSNTQGKKAKRKAREKMLDEAKRLSGLQKRRELKQAGLLSSSMRTTAGTSNGGKGRRKKNREIDLGVEIPFYKPVPAGFHDTLHEDLKADLIHSKRLKSVDYRRINEDQFRSRDQEERVAKKKEESRLRTLERTSMEHVISAINKPNDPVNTRKRGVLRMPEPAITDDELERVAKLVKDQEKCLSSVKTNGTLTMDVDRITDVLLGNYKNIELPLSFRNPTLHTKYNDHRSLTSLKESVNPVREAICLHSLQDVKTTFLVDDNLTMNMVVNDDLDVDSTATAGLSATKISASRSGGQSVTSSLSNIVDLTPYRTEPLDELGLNKPRSNIYTNVSNNKQRNDEDTSISLNSFATNFGTEYNMSIKELAKSERRASKKARNDLEDALKNLPTPKFEYLLETITDEKGDASEIKHEKIEGLHDDTSELVTEEPTKSHSGIDIRHHRQSFVVKRLDLPRPHGAINVRSKQMYEMKETLYSIKEADRLIEEEMNIILDHDARIHPVFQNEHDVEIQQFSPLPQKNKYSIADINPYFCSLTQVSYKILEQIPDSMLDLAEKLVQEELELLEQKKKKTLLEHGVSLEKKSLKNIFNSVTSKLLEEESDKMIYIIGDGWVVNNGSTFQLIAGLKTEYNAIKDMTNAIKKKSDKLESKLTVKHDGYAKRCFAINDTILQTFTELQNSATEELVYEMLMEHENKGLFSRLKTLENEVDFLERRNTYLQKIYSGICYKNHNISHEIHIN